MECFDALDRFGNKKGYKIERGLIPNDDDTFLGIVSIIIINKDNQILVTKRHPNKPAGMLWEVTGGGILAGEEPLESAKREVFEETGIKALESDFILLEQKVADYYYCYTFCLKLDYIPDIKLQEIETIDYKWLSVNEFVDFTYSNQFVSYIGIRTRRMIPLIKEKSLI